WRNAERASRLLVETCAGAPAPGANACDDTRARPDRTRARLRSRSAQVSRTLCSGAIAQFLHPRLLGAVIAAEHAAVGLQAVTDDARVTVTAGRCERGDRA